MLKTLLSKSKSTSLKFLMAMFFAFQMLGQVNGQNLQITEIWPGNEAGDNLSEDWFEIYNAGDEAWTSANGPVLYYDDDSADPDDASPIMGLTEIAAGKAVIVVIGAQADADAFVALWQDEIDLTNVEVGFTDGKGLGGGGDAVTLWVGDPNVDGKWGDYEGYPDAELFGGKSYDLVLGMFSEVGNAASAVATTELTGDDEPIEPATGSPGIIPPAPSGTDLNLTVEITADADLTEEVIGMPTNDKPLGFIDFSSSDLEFGSENADGTVEQRVGARFKGLNLPADATINSAYIQFEVDETGKNADPCVQTIYVEDAVNAAAFTATSGDLTSRTESSTTVEWTVTEGTWTEVGQAGEDQRTADISTLIQTIISKEGWMPGNAIAFFFEGTGRRVAKSYSTESYAKLVINASIPPAKPVIVREIENKVVRPGWSFSINVASSFEDLDSELAVRVSDLRGDALPVGVSYEGGVLSGSFSDVGYYTIKAEAEEKGLAEPSTVSQIFSIIVEPENNRFIKPLSSVKLGAYDEGAAEISAFDPSTDKLFVTNSETGMIDVIDMADPAAIVKSTGIDISTLGDGVTSVAVSDGLLVAAIPNDDTQMPGKVVAWASNSDYSATSWEVTVGALPDMVTFNEDGSKVLIANEGEPSSDYSNDPEGSVSIIDVQTGTLESTADFTAFNGMEAQLATEGVRVFGPNATVAQDLEPEYITVKGDSAYVTLQENNAIAIVRISTGVVEDIFGLGYKDHNAPGNGLDVPDTSNDEIYISNWPFKGIYMPDAIASYKVGTETYLVTANEGDLREYDTFEEEIEIGDMTLDPSSFTANEIADIMEFAGGLKSTIGNADTTAKGEFKSIYTIGSRSFSIWNAKTGAQVFDSGDDLEQITAAIYPENFNASNTNFSLKNRSDDKGPEPEAVTLGVIGDKTYAFVGLERVGGIMVYDVTDPASPVFIEYFNNRNFDAADDESEEALDSAPEGLIFISAADSPNGQNLLVVSNEVSGTVTVYSIGDAAAENPFTLAIFHNNDGESALLADTVMLMDKEVPVGSIGQFVNTLDSLRQQATDRGYESIMLSSGDNFLPGQTFNASNANGVFYDALALDAIDYDAICLGNHDFDFGTSVLADFIDSFQNNPAPYLTSNLGFDDVPELKSLVDAGRIAATTKITRGNQTIGVVGLTTPEITIISSPGNTEVSEMILDSAQLAVDELIADGVNKIILISHLQGLDEDLELVPQLSGVDIVIAGGGDELLSNDPELGKPFALDPADEYPITAQDKDGKEVYIVTTPGNYRFLGNLLVDFDADGNVTRVYDSNPVLVTGKANQDMIDNVEKPIRDYVKDLVTNVVAVSEVDLDFRKPTLRTGETNGGNLFADAMLWQAKQTYAEFGVGEPQVALQNGGGLRIEKIISKGDFNENLTYEIAAFTNIVSVVESVTPAKFLELMEWGVAEAPTENGRFPQIAGFEITYDQGYPSGDRVVSITLEDGTEIVKDGSIVEGAPNINMATIDFTANGGDGYPFGDLTYTTLGATYQQAFLNYLTDEDGLDGLISAADYPEDMNERIFVETSPLPALDAVLKTFDTTCPDLPEGWVEFHEGEDLISCGGGSNAYIDFNGYGVGAGASWMITPRVAFDGEYVLSFDYVNRFDGPDPEVFYSTDYNGYGDPSTATWTALTAVSDSIQVQPGGDDFAHIDMLMDGIATDAAIAFKYTSDGAASGESKRFRIDNVFILKPQSEPSEAISETFDTDPANWFEYNLENDLITYDEDKYIDFNGYAVGAGESFLTTPIIEFANELSNFTMSFDHVRRFSGPDVEVVYSKDYPGYGNPYYYTWDTLAHVSDSANVETPGDDFVNTGEISLADLSEPGVIGFAYKSEGDQGGQSLRFRLDSVVIGVGNLYPVVVSEMLADRTEDADFGSFEIDLTTAFIDVDGDEMTFEAVSGNTSVATVAVSGNTLTVSGVGYGTSEISITAKDAVGSVSGSFVLTVNEPLGVESGLTDDLVLFPVPTQDIINVLHKDLNLTDAKVYSIGGGLLKVAPIVEGKLDISELESGVYILELIDADNNSSINVRVLKL
ncbi:MAG: choice-of-anchor I family protein [Cyclobacteriaceae bacterium]